MMAKKTSTILTTMTEDVDKAIRKRLAIARRRTVRQVQDIDEVGKPSDSGQGWKGE